MLRLKIATTTCLIMATGLFLGLPLVMARRPDPVSTLVQKRAYLVVMLTYTSTMTLFLAATVLGALAIMRKNRQAFRDEEEANVRLLIETTLASHKKETSVERQEDDHSV